MSSKTRNCSDRFHFIWSNWSCHRYKCFYRNVWLKKIFIWWKISTLEHFSPASEIDLKQSVLCWTGWATSHSNPVTSCIQLMWFERGDFCLMTHVVTQPMGLKMSYSTWLRCISSRVDIPKMLQQWYIVWHHEYPAS